MLVQVVHAGKTDAVFPEQPWPPHTRHVTSENGWTTTTLQLATAMDDVLSPTKEGQSWFLLWDMASIHTMIAMKAKFPHVVLCFIPPHSTLYLKPCHAAVFRIGHEQGMATTVFVRMGSSRSHGALRKKPGVGRLVGVACVATATTISARP